LLQLEESDLTASRRLLAGLALAGVALAACDEAARPPAQTASLPNDAVVGAGDPLRSAAASVSTAFASPARLAGRPAEAARAIADMEFLAVELPNSPQLNVQWPTLGPQFAIARREWRGVLGIPEGVPAQPVINALFAAGRALDAGDRTAAARALPPNLFTAGGEATLARLAALPQMPLTNAAAVQALDSIQRQDPARGRAL
jgi:hypothetical protein